MIRVSGQFAGQPALVVNEGGVLTGDPVVVASIKLAVEEGKDVWAGPGFPIASPPSLEEGWPFITTAASFIVDAQIEGDVPELCRYLG